MPLTPLRQRFLDERARRNYSPRTVEADLAGVLRFVRYTGRAPDQANADDVRAFQLHRVAQQVSGSQFHQISCALRFLYTHVREQPDLVGRIPFARKPRRLPVILSPAEVGRLLAAVVGDRDRLMRRLTYGGGLRLSAVLHLRVADLDGARQTLGCGAARGPRTGACPCRRCC